MANTDAAPAGAGYCDLQVNGYYGVDFQQDDLTAEQLHLACARMEADGVSALLATIVTAPLDKMVERLRRIVSYRERDPLVSRLVVGLHIEGPFISPEDGYRGAHLRAGVIPPTPDAARALLDAAGGLARIVTLAPEMPGAVEVISLLARAGVRVSAGHCNPSLAQLEAAIHAGLSMFTHLGNGCPMVMHRHDNIVQRALSLSDRLWLMFIADGAHVAFPALRNYLRAAGMERTIVVTDCVTPAGKGPGRYKFAHWEADVGEDLVVMAPDRSHLIGSALDMRRAVANLVERVGLRPAEAHRLTVTNPRRAIGVGA